ncbi:MAG: hypothetical protein AAGB93_03010 [Planctomycetota bacterium]
MRLTPFLILTLTAPAVAQIAVDDFETGNNDIWGVEFVQPGTHMAAGGNPDGRVEITVSSSMSQLPAAMVTTANQAHPYQGDFRSLGVTGFDFDRQVESGSANFGSILFLVLAHDGGTFNDFADDAWIFVNTGNIFQFGFSPWETISTPIPSGDTTLPANWDVAVLPNSPLVGLTDDDVWNAVMQDVSYVGICMNRPFDGGFWFGSHVISFDNMVLQGDGAVGTNYCNPAVANSTGVAAQISATGSPAVASNSLSLNADQLPLNASCYFLTSQSQGFTANPGGSQGNLCLGGAIGRYVGAGQILNSGAAGSVTLALDLTMTPTPTGFVSVQAGETWNFQGWYRDAVGGTATSNLTDGVSVLFQ